MFPIILRQEMCEKAVEERPRTLEYVPDNLKTQEICDKAVDHNPWQLKDVPYHFKTEEMCKGVAEKGWLVLRPYP